MERWLADIEAPLPRADGKTTRRMADEDMRIFRSAQSVLS